MTSVEKIAIIIPTYEPDDRFIVLLQCLREEFGDTQPIIIVNDGSGYEYHEYFDRAEKCYSTIVLNHLENAGKGRALKTAFKFCLENLNTLGCITADSDGQHTATQIRRMAEELLSNMNSLVLGVRSFDTDNIPAKSMFGNTLTHKVFKTLYKVDIKDTQTGLRGIPNFFMKSLLEVPGDRFEFETRMLIKAVKDGIKINEIPIETIYDSKDSHKTHFRPIVDSIKIYSVFAGGFGRFLVASLSSSIIDIVAFQLLCSFYSRKATPINYVALSTIIARLISATYNYTVNYYFVFNSKRSHFKSGIGYIGLAVTQMCCSALLTAILVNLLSPPIESCVKVPVDICLFFVSFYIQKNIIY